MKAVCLILVLGLNLSLIFANSSSDAGRDSLTKQAWFFFEKSEQVIEVSLDSCIYYTQLAADCFEKAEDWQWQSVMLGAIGNVFYMKGLDHEARAFYVKAMKIARTKLDEIPYHLLNGYAVVFCKSRGQFDEALELLYEALALLEKKEGKLAEKSKLLENIGYTFFQKGDFAQAEQYLLQALKLKQSELGLADLATIKNANKLAACYRMTGNSEQAIGYLKQNLQYLEKQNQVSYAPKRYIEIYVQLGDLYLKKGLLDSCQFFIQEALTLQAGDFSLNKNLSYLVLGKLALQEGRYDLAIDHFEKSQQLSLLEYADFPFHTDIVESFYYLGCTYFEKGAFEKALNFYHQGLLSLCPSKPDVDIFDNPDPKAFVTPSISLKLLQAKASCLEKIGERTNDLAYYQAAVATFKIAIATLKVVRENYSSQEAKLFLGETGRSIFESALALTWKLYEQTKKREYLVDLYLFTEANKANLMLESIQAQDAFEQGGFPDSLRQRGHYLQNELVYYKKRILEAEYRENVEEEILQKWKLHQLDLEIAYDKFQRQLAKSHPNYFKYRYDYRLASVEEIQEQLPDQETALLHYFSGSKEGYLLLVTKSKIEAYPLPPTSAYDQKVDSLQIIISAYPTSQNYLAHAQQLANLGPTLFHQLLQPITNFPAIKHLIIVPDGVLHFLPFELLQPTGPLEIPQDFSLETFDFLLEHYTIGYAYSGTLIYLNQQKSAQSASKIWGGFAPEFDQSGTLAERGCYLGDLYSLNCNQGEVQNIKKILGGDAFLAQEASKEKFLERAAQYKILHLATHACVDRSGGSNNQIFFADDYISNLDLGLLTLKTELAVLSACNTASGRLLEGEGVLSLARSFTLAGVKSTLTSLWSVDDCSTSSIMEQFYAHLFSGKNKAEALQEAKQHHLQTTEKLYQHPYFWAAFVQYGNSKPIIFNKKRNLSVKLAIILVTTIIGLIGFFLYNLKKAGKK